MNFHPTNPEPLPGAVLMQHDAHTMKHCNRVGALVVAMATLLGFSDEQLLVVGMAASMHDVGKIDIPVAILHKPGALNAQEWAVMREHSARGEAIIRADRTLAQRDGIAVIVRHHHEHFDGSGYPDGIGGQEIPLAARLLSVVDSYDAMTESRAYHRVRSHQEALAVLESERGSKHDPLMVELIRSCDANWLIGLQAAAK